MTDYTYSDVFSGKDALPIGSPAKVIKATEFNTEFNNIETAINSKFDKAGGTFTGNIVGLSATFSGTSTLATVDINGGAIDGTVIGGSTAAAGSFTTVNASGNVTGANLNITNWNTAFGWGNHADAGYLTGFSESDPTVPSHVKNITTTNVSNWNTAYNDKINSASFSTSTGVLTLTQQDLDTVTVDLDGRYLQSYSETSTLDAVLARGATSALAATVGAFTATDISLGLWDIKLVGNDLVFAYNGTDRVRISTTGAVTAEGDVTAFGAA